MTAPDPTAPDPTAPAAPPGAGGGAVETPKGETLTPAVARAMAARIAAERQAERCAFAAPPAPAPAGEADEEQDAEVREAVARIEDYYARQCIVAENAGMPLMALDADIGKVLRWLRAYPGLAGMIETLSAQLAEDGPRYELMMARQRIAALEQESPAPAPAAGAAGEEIPAYRRDDPLATAVTRRLIDLTSREHLLLMLAIGFLPHEEQRATAGGALRRIFADARAGGRGGSRPRCANRRVGQRRVGTGGRRRVRHHTRRPYRRDRRRPARRRGGGA